MSETVAKQLESALSQHQLGNTAAARREYEAILERHPQCSQALHLLGLLEFQEGNQQPALARIGQAIAIDPSQAVYLNNYGAVLLSAGRIFEACECFQRAVSIRGDYADAHLNLGRAHQLLTQYAAAAGSFHKAIQLAPQNLDAYRLLAALLYDAGHIAKSIEVYQAAVGLAPTDAALWNDLGSAQLSFDQNDQAARSFRKAAELLPQLGEIWFNLGSALEQSLDIDGARNAVQSAMRLQPERTEWLLREALLCPPVFPSATAVEQFCESLIAKLQGVNGKLGSVDEERLFTAGVHPPLAAAFQGRDTRRLKEALADAVRPHIRPHASSGRAQKPRVGFVVTRGHAALFERCSGGLIERMNNREFDLFILCSAACTRSLRERIQRSEVNYIDFPDNYAAAASAISAAQCDVLYHWEVGTDSLNFLLPLARLAPVQCTSWGTQTTSGLREVDYYLSSQWLESPEADRFCTEKLIRCQNLPTYQRRIPVPKPAHRSEFGLSDQSNLYLCPQNLLKIHPDQDALFSAILDGNPAAVIVLKETGSAVPGEMLRRRFRTTMKQNAERVHFVPWLSSADYYRLLTVADVILDPIHYSAGSSAYDFFSLGLPVVTLPGQLNVSRYTQACYLAMDFHELIASDKNEYVTRAIQVATDPDYRKHVSGEIGQRSECLFETDSAAHELKDLFLKMIAQARS